jgi:hypothetical protein
MGAASILMSCFNTKGDKFFVLSQDNELLFYKQQIEKKPYKKIKLKPKIQAICANNSYVYLITEADLPQILRYDLECKFVDSRSIHDFSSMSNGFGKIESFNVKLYPTFEIFNEDFLLIETADGVMIVQDKENNKSKIVSGLWTTSWKEPGSFQFVGGNFLIQKNNSFQLFDLYGQLVSQYNQFVIPNSIFGFVQSEEEFKMSLGVNNIVVSSNSNSEYKLDTLLHKPSGLYIQSGESVYYTTKENEIRSWNLQSKSGQSVAKCSANFYINCMAVNDDFVIVSIANSSTLKIFNRKKGKWDEEIVLNFGEISSLFLEKEIIHIGTSSGDYVTYSQKERKVLHNENLLYDGISCIKVLNNTKLIGGNGRMLLKLDDDSSKLLIGQNGYVNAIDLKEIKGRVYALTSSAEDHYVRVWDLKEGVLLKEQVLDSFENVSNVSFIEDLFFIVLSEGKYAYFEQEVLNAQLSKSLNVNFQTSNSSGENMAKISPEEDLLAMYSFNNIKILDLKTGLIRQTIQVETLNDIEILSDNKALIVLKPKGLTYIDPYTGCVLKEVEWKHNQLLTLHQIRKIPQRSLLLGFNNHGWHAPYLIHENSGKLLGNIYLPTNQNTIDIQFSKDGKFMAVYGTRFIELYEVNDAFFNGTMQPYLQIPNPNNKIMVFTRKKLFFDNEVNQFAFKAVSQDGKTIETHIYNIASKKLVSMVNGLNTEFGYHNRIIKQELNNSFSFIDPANQTVIKRLVSSSRHMGKVNDIIYSNKFNRILTLDEWGNYKIWEGSFGANISESNRFDNDVYHSIPLNNVNKVLYTHKQGVFMLDLNTFEINQIQGAQNYPFNIAYASSQNSLYYFSESKKNLELFEFNLKNSKTKLKFSLPKGDLEAGKVYLSKNNNRLAFIIKDEADATLYCLNLLNDSIQKTTVKVDYSLKGFHQSSDEVLVMGIFDNVKRVDLYSHLSRDLVSINVNTQKITKHLNSNYVFLTEMLTKAVYKSLYALSEQFSANQKYITTIQEDDLAVCEWESGKTIYKVANSSKLKGLIFSNDEKFVYLSYENGDLTKVSLNDSTEIKLSNLNNFGNGSLLNNDLILLNAQNNELIFYDLNSNKKVATAMIADGDQLAILLPNNHYYASAGALKHIAFKTLKNTYKFEQFDLLYNRPHAVLEALNSENKTLVSLKKQAWEKRLDYYGIKDVDRADFEIPTVYIDKSKLPLNTSNPNFEFKVNVEDNMGKVEHVQAWVNNVPVYAGNGMAIPNQKSSTLQTTLSQGLNKFQVSCTNSSGKESFREHFEIYYNPETPKPKKRYVISIAVSNYKDERYNLKYAVKDGKDLMALFSENEDFGEIVPISFFDSQVTINNIKGLKNILQKTSVDDQVVIFIAGHGLLDSNQKFYFASYDMNFEKPAEKGISYEMLENLLTDIPARNKLFLMDACHSGEVDPGSKTESTPQTTEEENIVSGWSGRGVIVLQKTKKVGLTNSFYLMQDLFANLNRGSGTVVISAASGDGLAIEGDVWQNGVFTYSIKKALSYTPQNYYYADLNKDDTITINELKRFVLENVSNETKGRQRATSRRENAENDFIIK